MTDEVVEVSRARLSLLEGVAKLKEELWNDPKHGMTIKKIVKEKYPDANLPEVDADATVRKAENDILSKVEEANKANIARIEAFEKSQKDREDKDAEKTATKNFESDVEATKKKYQLTPEGMEKVFARMKEKNNPDVEAAAAWVTDHEQKASPVTNSSYAPQDMNLYGSSQGDKEWEDLNKDPIKFFDKTVTDMLNDFGNGNQSKYREFGGTV